MRFSLSSILMIFMSSSVYRKGTWGLKNLFFIFYFGQIRIILPLPAYAQCMLARIFDFEFSQKKVVFRFVGGPLECVKLACFDY